jgi:hypothetical protein
VSPWQGGGGLVDRALAAIGSQPVLHVVITQPSPDGQELVDLTTGRPIPQTQRTEIWFDGSRDLKKTVTTLNGAVLDEMLETAEGGFTRGGPIYTCAWIARHPVEATKARVSCNANMENGTTPRKVPEEPPTIELALAGFLDHYRSALASRQAAVIGEGTIAGRKVTWLRIETASARGGVPSSQEVAIDSTTYKPVRIRPSANPAAAVSVDQIETVAYDPALFTHPARVHGPSIGQVAGASEIEHAQAAPLLGGRAFWLGDEWNGLRLVSTRREQLTTGYGRDSGRRPMRSTGVAFEYAPIGEDGTTTDRPLVIIRQSDECPFAYGWTCSPRDPSGTAMRAGPPTGFPSIFFRLGGLYMAISDRGSGLDPIELARALTPAPG